MKAGTPRQNITLAFRYMPNMTLAPSLVRVGATHSSPTYISRKSACEWIETCRRRKPRTPMDEKKSLDRGEGEGEGEDEAGVEAADGEGGRGLEDPGVGKADEEEEGDNDAVLGGGEVNDGEGEFMISEYVSRRRSKSAIVSALCSHETYLSP